MSATSRAKNALRFLLATPKERRYARKIKASGQFDRDFTAAWYLGYIGSINKTRNVTM